MEKKRNVGLKGKRLSLHPLSLEQALKGVMETGPLPKKSKPKKRRKGTDRKPNKEDKR